MKSALPLKQESVSQILRKLMAESTLTEAELARRVNLPQTTINRLLLGGTSDPRANTLKPIADFFGITIGQLCGFESLSEKTADNSAWRFFPIIEWEQVNSWIFTNKSTTPLTHKHWVGTERQLSDKSFALRSLSFMEPRFRKNSILIVNSAAKYKDGHYVVVALDQFNPSVRKIIIDGSNTLLQSFDQTQPSIKLNNKHTVYGTIVESRMDTYL